MPSPRRVRMIFPGLKNDHSFPRVHKEPNCLSSKSPKEKKAFSKMKSILGDFNVSESLNLTDSGESFNFSVALSDWIEYSQSQECINNLLPVDFDVNKFYFIGGYIFLLIIGAIENISAFVHIVHKTYRNPGVKLLLLNLTLANMIITFVIIPIEISWRITISWPTNQFGCKVLQVIRALGPYLTSNILTCISIDRYLVLTNPLNRRSKSQTKFLLSFSWILSVGLSLPQGVVFRLERHPICTSFIQCVPLYYFDTPLGLKTYNLFILTALYVIPLLIIVVCYSLIIYTVFRQSRELENFDQSSSSAESTPETGGRSDLNMVRASVRRNARRDLNYRRTLKKTALIILAFLFCWSPFVCLVFLSQVYPNLTKQLNPYFKDALLMFAVSNSCVNPLVYGTHTSVFLKLYRKCRNPVYVPGSRRVTMQMDRTGGTQIRRISPTLATGLSTMD